MAGSEAGEPQEQRLEEQLLVRVALEGLDGAVEVLHAGRSGLG